LIEWKKEETSLRYSSRTLSNPSLFLMFREKSFRDSVSGSYYQPNMFIIVQFEEKKFLETAKKIIQGSVANASSKLENE
jgi:hypothetical protein